MAYRKSPQDKKLLSYAKDRRNNYGENDKSSRKNIRRNRQAMHRANRHRARQVLHGAVGTADQAVAATAEERLLVRRPKSWRKWPDLPLGIHVEGTLERRLRLGIRNAADHIRLLHLRRRLRRPDQPARRSGAPYR